MKKLAKVFKENKEDIALISLYAGLVIGGFGLLRLISATIVWIYYGGVY